jgi:uncharacterized membrane protein
MLCPRCHASSDERFCRQCGLDLQIYAELAALKEELANLRKVIVSGDLPKQEIMAGRLGEQNRSAAESNVTPPPLPPPPLPQLATKSHEKRAGSERSSAELAVGQKWFLGIGVLIFIVGVGFFLKYAFDQEWIGPAVQISLGFICGLGLLAFGNLCHRRNLRGLDVGFVAVGLGTLYLSSYSATQVHHLLPGSMALVLIFVTTAVGVSLARLWTSQGLAILTFLGGYLAPLLFASGQIDPWLFLGYLLILTLGSQILAYAQDWRHLYSGGAALTWLSLAVWSHRDYRKELFQETFLFTQILFAAYSLMPFLRPVSKKEPRRGFLLAVVNGLLCSWYSAFLLDYQKWPEAIVSLSYAIVTLGVALLLRRRLAPGLYSSWLIAQAVVFLLLFWAQTLSDDWVTVFWSAELVALYWVAAKCNDRTLLFGTFLIGLAVVFQHFGNALAFLFESPISQTFTAGMVGRWSAGLSVVAGLLLVSWLDRLGKVGGTHQRLSYAFEALGVLSLFGFANVELYRFTTQFMRTIEVAGISVLWTLFAAGLMLIGLWMRRKAYRLSAIVLLIVTVLKVLAYDTAEVSTPYRILSCLVLGGMLVAVSFLYYRFSERLAGK